VYIKIYNNFIVHKLILTTINNNNFNKYNLLFNFDNNNQGILVFKQMEHKNANEMFDIKVKRTLVATQISSTKYYNKILCKNYIYENAQQP
jgi:hypothetical protein